MQIDTTSNQSHRVRDFDDNRESMVPEFKFPLKTQQLCDEPADITRFWVKALRGF